MKGAFIILSLLLWNSLIYSQDYCGFIEMVESYQNKVRLEKDLNSIDTSTFNLGCYLSIFDLLKKNNSLEYCYSYYNSGLDGQPILFVKDSVFDIDKYVEQNMNEAKDEIEEKAIKNTLNNKNATDVIKKKREIQARISDNYRKGYSAEYKLDSAYTMKNHLIPEESKMGYFQYLYFALMGESFAGYWHSTERNVICSYEKFEKVRENYENFTKEEGDLSPIILMNKEKCIITWYEYIEMNGIYKRTYEIKRVKPFKIERVESVLFANEIDDGIIY